MSTPPPCPEWADALAAQLPEDLSPSRRAALARHLRSCPGCAQASQDYGRLTARIRAATQEDRFLILNHQLERLRTDMRTLRTAGKPVSPLFQEGPPSQSSFSFAETSLSGRAEQTGRGQKVEGMLRASDEIQLHYQILGNGPHPLLIPAMHWSLAGCEELLSHHTLIFYDRHRRRTPGEPWPSVSSLSWELETLCRYLGLAQVSLLGWSRFGNIAAHYAFRHTERIARLILIRPVSPPCELRTASDASLPVSREGDFPGASSCHIPTLVIHGGDDPLPVSASRIWAATLPNARLLTMRGAGPSPWDDTPRAFSAAVTQFLAGAWPEAAVCITAQSA